MLRHAALITLLVCSGAMSAQIFPKIEKKDVKQRVAQGKSAQPEPEPEPEPEDEPEVDTKVDGDTVLARYREILQDYFDDERATKKATTKHTDDLHDSIRKFFEGVCMLRLGFYKDAATLFKNVRYKVEDEEHIKNEEVAKIARDIKRGAAYYYLAMAVAMEQWDSFEDRAALDEAWLEAKDEALEVKDDLASLVRRGLVEDGDEYVQAIGVWVHEAKDHWIKLWRAEQNVEKFPHNVNTWRTLVKCTSAVNYKLENEYTPSYLKQRAAIAVIKEFWPESEYVTGGQADIALGGNHITTGQLDDWEDHYRPKPYHTDAAKKVLNVTKLVVQKLVDAIEDMKTD